MNSQDKVITGGCFCGNVRYRASGTPYWVGHCHCVSCRKQTGAPVVTFVAYEKNQVAFTSGERKFHHSSEGVARGFCGDCGTPLTWEGESGLEGRGEVIEFYISTLDDPETFRPENHVWYSEKLSWFDVEDSLPLWSGFDYRSELVERD